MQVITLFTPTASVSRRLDPDRFVRINRSTIVQIDRIAELVSRAG